MFPVCRHSGDVVPTGKRFCNLKQPFLSLEDEPFCWACPHHGEYATSLEPICTAIVRTTECVHRGVMRLETCPTCQGNVRVKVFACDVHRECVPEPFHSLPLLRACNACPDVTTPAQAKLGPLTGPANLMWFVYPKKSTREVWERQQETIRESIGEFDGKKVCAIACDDSTAADEIDRHLWDEVIELPNDHQARELHGWRWTMSLLKGEPGFTVRLHAKGAWRGTAEQHMSRWWELGYERLLDVERVRESLQTHVVTGPFRRNVPANNLGVPWHYSGALYAFRNDVIFGTDWEPVGSVAPGWYVEAWPALVASRELAGSVGWDGVGDLYQAKSWRDVPDRVPDVVVMKIPQKETPLPIVKPPELVPFPAVPRPKSPAVSRSPGLMRQIVTRHGGIIESLSAPRQSVFNNLFGYTAHIRRSEP